MPSSVRHFLRQWATTFLFIIGLFAFRSSFADWYRVPTGSMIPTITPGDWVFVNKAAYDWKIPFAHLRVHTAAEPQRGDIVVFRSPPDRSVNFVKRLIGLPGDRVVVTDSRITVNGEPVEVTPLSGSEVEAYRERLGAHRYVVQRLSHSNRRQSFVVPEGKYFFMGDNRDDSLDSRYWGFVPREDLRGKVVGTLWGFQRSSLGLPLPRAKAFFHFFPQG